MSAMPAPQPSSAAASAKATAIERNGIDGCGRYHAFSRKAKHPPWGVIVQIFLDSGRVPAVCVRAMRRTLLAALLALPCLATAADLPVLYTVQEKPLKTMAIAGTSLTFELFRDTACTIAAVYTTSIPVENVTIIRRLKQLTPKG